MKVKIFLKDGCANCPPAKDLGQTLEKDGVNVEYHDITTIDGLAESTFFGVMSTPSILVVGGDDTEKIGWRSAVPGLDEVRKVLSE